MNLHIHNDGPIPDWINLDISNKFNHRRLPYRDAIFDYVYITDTIEYLDMSEVGEFFAEVKRILKPSGMVKISAFDFFKLHKLYPHKTTLQIIDKYIHSKKCVNGQICHTKMCYDFITLQKLLIMAGFYAIKRYDSSKTLHKDFIDNSSAMIGYDEISLNVECYG